MLETLNCAMPLEPVGSLDALDDRHRSTRDRETRQIERHGEQDAAKRVHEVPGRQIPAIAAARDERLSFRRLQRLHDDLRLVPAIGRGGRGEGEQQPLATRQHLWAVHHLAVLDADEHLWLAAVRRDAHNACGLTEDDPGGVPGHPQKRRVGRTDRDRRSAVDGDLLNRSVPR